MNETVKPELIALLITVFGLGIVFGTFICMLMVRHDFNKRMKKIESPDSTPKATKHNRVTGGF